MDMESLLCDEVWLSSPPAQEPHHNHHCSSNNNNGGTDNCFYKTTEESEEAACIFLDKEVGYMPESGYVDHCLLHSNNLAPIRFRAIHWFIQSRSRFSLQFGTVFIAANYLDRFISLHRFHEWKHWMVELLAMACLSIASKFDDTSSPSLHEIIQMEDLDYSFEPSTIRRMELTVLNSLGWRLASITAYSYMELMLSNFDNSSLDSHIPNLLATPLTNLLLGALLDVRLLEYQPSVIAVSALLTASPSNQTHVSNHIISLFNQKQKDDVIKCCEILNSSSSSSSSSSGLVNYIDFQEPYNNLPASPVTVLNKERIDIHDSRVDLSIFKPQHMMMPSSCIDPESCVKNKKKKKKKKKRRIVH